MPPIPSPAMADAPSDLPSAGAEAELCLMQRLANRDSNAVAEVYAQYGAMIFSYALRTLGNRQDAEEILQDTFVRLWEKAAQYNPELGRPFTWVFMVARGLCQDRLRQIGRRQRKHQAAAPTIEASLDSSNHSWPTIFSHDELRHVVAALQLLPELDRRAVEMAVFLECTGMEIADQTREPLGTVKTRVRRGLAKLRQLLKNHHD
jgi:RNA polymerase sigma-70 factor (ECF subfamily)